MSDQKPYMREVAFTMDRFKAYARDARQEAAKLITQAETWECAASQIDIALSKEMSAAASERTNGEGSLNA